MARDAFVEAAGGEDAEGGCELGVGVELVLMGVVVGSCGMGEWEVVGREGKMEQQLEGGGFTHMLFPIQSFLFKRVEGRVFADLEFAAVFGGAERCDLLVVFGVVVDGD